MDVPVTYIHLDSPSNFQVLFTKDKRLEICIGDNQTLSSVGMKPDLWCRDKLQSECEWMFNKWHFGQWWSRQHKHRLEKKEMNCSETTALGIGQFIWRHRGRQTVQGSNLCNHTQTENFTVDIQYASEKQFVTLPLIIKTKLYLQTHHYLPDIIYIWENCGNIKCCVSFCPANGRPVDGTWSDINMLLYSEKTLQLILYHGLGEYYWNCSVLNKFNIAYVWNEWHCHQLAADTSTFEINYILKI